MHRSRFGKIASRVLVRLNVAAVALLVLVAAGVTPVSHAAEKAAPATVRRYEIPAGPLSRSLSLFAAESGILLSADATLSAEKTAPALQGNYSVHEGFAYLLAGSGLEAVIKTSGTYTLRRTATSAAPRAVPVAAQETKTEPAITLPQVTVQDTRDQGYTAGEVTIGSKIPTSLREIPQSLSVITRQRIEDQNLTTLQDALKQTTGITVQSFDSAGQRNDFVSRGFSIDSIQIDGLPANLLNANFATAQDLAIYDRVEVLRGPAGLFQGSGEPGGAINLVRKRALSEFAVSGAFSAGSWDNFRGEADVTGPLLSPGKLRGRLVTAYENRRSFVDVVKAQKPIVYGTLAFDATDATTVSVGAMRQESDFVPSQGLPAYADGRLLDVKRSTFIGTDWAKQDTNTTDTFAEIEHRFSGGGHIKLSNRYVDRTSDGKYSFANGAVNPVTGVVAMRPQRQDSDAKEISLDGHVTRPVKLFGQTHNFLLGMDYRTQDLKEQFGNGTTFSMNVFNPNHDQPEPNITITGRNKIELSQYGPYGQARIKPLLDWTTIIFGGRVSWWDTKTKNLLTNQVTAKSSVQHEFTPYGGLVIDVASWLSLYGSYAEIFQPQANLNVDREVLPPRVGAQYEAGVKAEFFDRKLNAHFAVFRIRDENRSMADPANPGFFIAAGKVQSQGLEAEVNSRPLSGWDISAGYAFKS
jgi:outer membrane receptor for ferric coprogen and ferric-rhodotorulic acid